MPIRNLHEKPFDEGTQDKLSLYREYLRKWLPVFINAKTVEKIQVFDFFAGPGLDVNGNQGSPAITCREIKDAVLFHKEPILKEIRAYFNEKDRGKFQNLLSYISEEAEDMPWAELKTENDDFQSTFEKWEPHMHGNSANLLFLDQNGVKEISQTVFETIVRLQRTDFIFFISSAMVNRFKSAPEIRNFVPVTDADFERMNGTNVHRIVADSYRRWLPQDVEYYLGSFSIRKGPNVYGLVFGSGHPLGIDKFLKVAWKHGGDANFDIDQDGIDPIQMSLPFVKPTKIMVFEKELETAVLNRQLLTNKEIYLFSLKNGMLPAHAKNGLIQMIKNKKIPDQVLHISYDAWKKPQPEKVQFI